jgi:uncharacterized protein YqhQ
MQTSSPATPTQQFTSIGGQAVIEGVMMRSPHFIAVAVRKPDGRITIRQRPYEGISGRIKLLRKPLLRGVVTLVESMVQGMEALGYSAQVAVREEKDVDADSEAPIESMGGFAIASSIVLAFGMGMGLFVVLPHLLAAIFARADNPLFHVIDGALKMTILLGYVYLIALMKDIHRVFQYHGAEHKSIYTFEAGEELSVANARKYTTLHPRCGTSFLFFLILISVLVFSAVFPLFGLTTLSPIPIVNHLFMVALKIVLMFPVAGLAYEFIKMCACRMQNPVFRVMIWPGMILQKLTTREPSDDQLEVALASLRQVLRLEKGGEQPVEITVGALDEIGLVAATVAEFSEG